MQVDSKINYPGNYELRNRREHKKSGTEKNQQGTYLNNEQGGDEPGTQVMFRTCTVTDTEKNYVAAEKTNPKNKKKEPEKNCCAQWLEGFGKQNSTTTVGTSDSESSCDDWYYFFDDDDDDWSFLGDMAGSSTTDDCQTLCEDMCAGASDFGECMAQCMDECDTGGH